MSQGPGIVGQDPALELVKHVQDPARNRERRHPDIFAGAPAVPGQHPQQFAFLTVYEDLLAPVIPDIDPTVLDGDLVRPGQELPFRLLQHQVLHRGDGVLRARSQVVFVHGDVMHLIGDGASASGTACQEHQGGRQDR